ncbi:MAG: hypothetical protein ACX939_07445 [Hyphococcus sp.]
MTELDGLLKALQAFDLLADLAIVLIGMETLRQRDRITRVESGLDFVMRRLLGEEDKLNEHISNDPR